MLQDSSSPRIQFQNLSATSLYGFDDPLGFRRDHDLLLDSNNSNNIAITSTNHKIVGNTSNNQGLMSHSSPLLPTSSSSANSSNGFTIHGSSYLSKEANQSLINFKMVQYKYGSDFMHGGGSLLSFQHQSYDQRSRYPNEFPIWEDSNIIGCSSALQSHVKLSNNLSSLDEVNYNCFQTSSGNQYLGNGWSSSPFVDSTLVADRVQDSRTPIARINKRPHPDEVKSMQGMKKQCTSNSKSTKPKSTISPTKDPQSIAAKNRRERISERLKILQDLVPNGSKVDLNTMLEKAISYVKFLQLQVKVLAADEFWPAAGGKAPDISQVREAIDAILSSHRHSN